MKKILFYIALLFLVAEGYAQNLQNSNWRFGNYSGLTLVYNDYNAQSVITTPTFMPPSQSCASVSDRNGNLLFYTNGVKVWNKNNQQMLNGFDLFGNVNNTQGVIIVPRPGFEHNFYIITIDGYSGTKKGLYYSEVSMALNQGLGDVISKNVNLKDPNGTYINNSYLNNSEKLTSTVHSNGVDYWVVTQINGNLCSYQVRSTGISVIPVSSPAQIAISGLNGQGQLKISPDSKRISIAYANGSSSSIDSASIGLFNNFTGYITFIHGPHPLYDEGTYGTAWTSNIDVYFSSKNSISATTVGPDVYGFEVRPYPKLRSLELGIDQALYGAGYDGNLYILKDPDQIFEDGPGSEFEFVATNIGSSTFKWGLPAWVYSQCTNNLTLKITDVISYDAVRQVSDYISAKNTITPGVDVEYNAGRVITLYDGFKASNGSDFWAHIDGCPVIPIAVTRLGQFETTEHEEQILVKASATDTGFFSLAPNPANSIITITATEAMRDITITSQDGKTLYSRAMPDKTTSIDIPVANYSNGVYTVTVTTADGKMQTKKLVKN